MVVQGQEATNFYISKGIFCYKLISLI